ncbi:hypothetical protein [Pedobacter miscanthi]|uniref:hypothetical protein n=1 Tax=Pedobacter miscanthi TaxID=2259170 RepID=UPI0029315136|nr:hypothetical protein [Pedobacter miscanthi]
MSERSAEATIKGYYYQFDTSILKLLMLGDDSDHIVVEGIEDIDIHTADETTAVQCKYLSKPSFINSAVREPIMLMLDHFRLKAFTSAQFNYVLYAHFENEVGGQEKAISLNQLKDILTFTEKKIPKCYHTDNGMTDENLINFLNRFKFVFGKKFEDQQLEVIALLKKRFTCSAYEADNLYYNNSLRRIMDLSIKADARKRKINKRDFITSIDIGKQLLSEWHNKLKTKKERIAETVKVIKSTKSDLRSKTKYVIIGKDLLEAMDTEVPVLTFLEALMYKTYSIGTIFKDAKPLTVVMDLDAVEMLKVKVDMVLNNHKFNDGMETILFSPERFNEPPIINTDKTGNRIMKSDYSIKLLMFSSFIAKIDEIQKPKVVFNFGKQECPYPKASEYIIFDIKLFDNLKDILTIF